VAIATFPATHPCCAGRPARAFHARSLAACCSPRWRALPDDEVQR